MRLGGEVLDEGQHGLRRVIVATIGGVPVEAAGNTLRWTAGLAVDADGSPHAYHPNDTGLDSLANARTATGRWVGIVTLAGVPYIQGSSDPAPGYYVSPTALCDPRWPRTDPRRYPDALVVPYLAIPPELTRLGLRMGDVAWVRYRDAQCAAIIADVGPRGKLGEGSCALAIALGIDANPRRGGTSGGVSVTAWKASRTRQPWPRSVEGIAREVDVLRAAIGA